MSIKLRFRIMLAAVVLVPFIIYVGLMVAAERKFLGEKFEGVRRFELEKLGVVFKESILSKDQISLMNYVKEFKRNPEVLSVMVLDTTGLVVAHSDFAHIHEVMNDPQTHRALSVVQIEKWQDKREAEAPIAEYIVPVGIGGKRLGIARVAYDARYIEDQVDGALRQAVKRYVFVVALVLIVALGVASLVADNLSRPLGWMSEAFLKVGRGEFNAEIPYHKKDEVGKLVAEFNKMVKRLSELNELKDQFVENISHDLRNPLGVISMSAKLLMDDRNLPPAQFHMLEIVVSSVNRLMTSINNTLDAARMKVEPLSIYRTWVPLNKIVDDIESLYRMSAAQTAKLFEIDRPARLPEVNVDQEKIHRVFDNLVSNALKFTSKGGRVKVTIRENGHPGALLIAVSDQGPGIAEDQMQDLFHRFGTLTTNDSLVKRRQGTGLGLAITKAIIEQHGGKIWVESEVGRGTTFWFDLPTDSGGNESI